MSLGGAIVRMIVGKLDKRDKKILSVFFLWAIFSQVGRNYFAYVLRLKFLCRIKKLINIKKQGIS